MSASILNTAAGEIAGLARRQLHVILALDCSGSMQGDRMASLNYALRTTLPELREVAEENPEIEVRLRILRFSTEAEWRDAEAVPIAEARWTDLSAGGETSMGAALRLIGQALETGAMPGRQLPPVVVLVSDGYPTDDFEAGLEAFFAAEHAESAVRLAIAIGGEADSEVLERFIRRPSIRPLRASNAADLVRHIKWATTAPVKTASSPTNAPDPLASLAQRTAQEADAAADISHIIW